MTSNTPIESLPNLGPTSGQWLREVGVNTIEDLESIGPSTAYQLVKQHRGAVSLNLLWALVAGIEGKDWRELCDDAKLSLKSELNEAGG